MKNYLLILVCLCSLFITPFQSAAQGWDWAKIGSGNCNIEGSNVAIGRDNEGAEGIYGLMSVSASIPGSITVSLGAMTIYNATGNMHIILAKYDSAGVAQWVFPVLGYSNPIGVAADDHGSVYMFSSFRDSVALGTTTLRTTVPCYFIAKFSSSGVLLWAKKDGAGCWGGLFGTAYFAPAGGIRCDAAGNVYAASYYTGTGTSIGSYTLTNTGPSTTADMFIAKYDPAGNVIWAKNIGGTENDYLRALSVSQSGTIAIGGTFLSPAMSIGSTVLSAPVATHHKIFVAIFDSSGNPLWAEATGNNKTIGVANYVSALAFDKSDNLFITGTFADTLVFASTNILTPKPDTGSLYLVKLSAAHQVAWYKTAVSPPGTYNGYVLGLSVATDLCGNVWVEGSMGGYLSKGYPYISISGHKIDSAVKVYMFPSHSADPGFIAGFNPGGGFIGGKALQSGFDDCNQIVCGHKGELYFVSDYMGGYLIAGSDNYIDTSDKERFLIARYKYDTTGCTSGHSSDVPGQPVFHVATISLYPNPAEHEFTISSDAAFPPGSKTEVYDLSGRLMFTSPLSGIKTTISIGPLVAGIYQCRIMSGDVQATVKKLVIIK